MVARLLAVAVLASSAGLTQAIFLAAPPPASDTGNHSGSRAGELVDVVRRALHGHSHYTCPALKECVPCWMHSDKRPRLFLQEESMGVGTRLHGFLNGMAVAAKHGFNLGGIISLSVANELHGKSHGVEVLSVVTAFLGLKRPEELFADGPPEYDATFNGVADMVKQLESGLILQKGDTALLKPGSAGALANIVRENEGGDYYTERFKAALRWSGAPINQRKLFSDVSKPLVAMHVRRGDMSLECERCQGRTTPDEWNIWMLGQIQNLLPDADVHVFSSLEGRHTSEEFNGYREVGATVHLDDLDILDPWAHFARAHVVVLAKSSFSWAPALVNPYCVVYQSTYLAHLPDWISTRNEWGSPDQRVLDIDKLKSCIDRVVPPARVKPPARPKRHS